MGGNLTLAYFPAYGDEDLGDLLRQQHNVCTATAVQSVEMLSELHESHRSGCDAILVPAKLLDGSNGITTCASIRSVSTLSEVALAGYLTKKEAAGANAFYSAGADLVIVPPFDAEMIIMQLNAMKRLRFTLDQQATQNIERTILLNSFAQAFDSIPEGILLAEPSRRLTSCNSACISLLNYADAASLLQSAALQKQIDDLIVRFDNSTKRREPQKPQDTAVFSLDAPLTRSNGQSFPAKIQIRKLVGSKGTALSYMIVASDNSYLSGLRELLEQYRRTRSVLLLVTASAFTPLASNKQGVLVDPLSLIIKSGAGFPAGCSVNSVISCLLGVLDTVVSPSIAIKVNMRQDAFLALAFGDLFQMLGHLILSAVEHAGLAGETDIDVGPNIPGEGVTLAVTSTSRRIIELTEDSGPLATLLAEFAGGVTRAARDELATRGISCPTAEQIAVKYRSVIEYQRPAPSTIKFRVRLPVAKQDL